MMALQCLRSFAVDRPPVYDAYQHFLLPQSIKRDPAMTRSRFAATAALIAVLFACQSQTGRAAEPNTLTDQEKAAGWKLLFDGKSTDGWRNYKKDTIGPGWKVIDGALTRADNGAGDILTKQQYGSFELSLDYNISKGGNSGLMYHVTEEGGTPWQTGPEIQIQDNVDGKDPQKAGWLYQLYKAETDATKPAGEWNTLRILITPEKCEHTMNGIKYTEYVKGSKDWDERVAKSKFASMPKFGKPTNGFISLQDHGNLVAFRNIKIREVPATK